MRRFITLAVVTFSSLLTNSSAAPDLHPITRIELLDDSPNPSTCDTFTHNMNTYLLQTPCSDDCKKKIIQTLCLKLMDNGADAETLNRCEEMGRVCMPVAEKPSQFKRNCMLDVYGLTGLSLILTILLGMFALSCYQAKLAGRCSTMNKLSAAAKLVAIMLISVNIDDVRRHCEIPNNKCAPVFYRVAFLGTVGTILLVLYGRSIYQTRRAVTWTKLNKVNTFSLLVGSALTVGRISAEIACLFTDNALTKKTRLEIGVGIGALSFVVLAAVGGCLTYARKRTNTNIHQDSQLQEPGSATLHYHSIEEPEPPAIGWGITMPKCCHYLSYLFRNPPNGGSQPADPLPPPTTGCAGVRA